MATAVLCDICNEEAGEDRITIQAPFSWDEPIDICGGCYEQKLANAVEAHCNPKKRKPWISIVTGEEM